MSRTCHPRPVSYAHHFPRHLRGYPKTNRETLRYLWSTERLWAVFLLMMHVGLCPGPCQTQRYLMKFRLWTDQTFLLKFLLRLITLVCMSGCVFDEGVSCVDPVQILCRYCERSSCPHICLQGLRWRLLPCKEILSLVAWWAMHTIKRSTVSYQNNPVEGWAFAHRTNHEVMQLKRRGPR